MHERVGDKAAQQIISVNEVTDETIIHQFRNFLERLEQEMKNKEEADLDSKEMTKLFLKKKESCTKKRDSCTLHLRV